MHHVCECTCRHRDRLAGVHAGGGGVRQRNSGLLPTAGGHGTARVSTVLYQSTGVTCIHVTSVSHLCHPPVTSLSPSCHMHPCQIFVTLLSHPTVFSHPCHIVVASRIILTSLAHCCHTLLHHCPGCHMSLCVQVPCRVCVHIFHFLSCDRARSSDWSGPMHICIALFTQPRPGLQHIPKYSKGKQAT